MKIIFLLCKSKLSNSFININCEINLIFFIRSVIKEQYIDLIFFFYKIYIIIIKNN